MKNTPYERPASDELPIGFGVALAKNEAALTRFGQMTDRQKQQVLFDVRHTHGRQELQEFVDRIGANG